MKKVWASLQEENSILVCDFDGTLTLSGSSMNGIVHILGPEDSYSRARNRLYQRYGRKLMTDEEGPHSERLAASWWREQMELYVQYRIQENLLLRVGRMLPERRAAVELLEKCQDAGIPVWIVSAGVANVIEEWLEVQALSRDGIQILANRLCFKNEEASGYSRIVTPWNKSELFQELSGVGLENKLVFLGDRSIDLCWREAHSESFLIQKNTGIVTLIDKSGKL